MPRAKSRNDHEDVQECLGLSRCIRGDARIEDKMVPVAYCPSRSLQQLPSNSHCRKLLFLSLCIFLLGGEVALPERESRRQLAVTPTLDQSLENDESAPAKNFSCLPKDVRADEVVSYDVKGKSTLTVEKKLIELKARCRRGKLVD